MASAALAHDDGDDACVRLVRQSMTAMAVDAATFPRYSELMLPLLQAVQSLGGSASSREITAALVELQGFTDQQMAVTYPTRDRSVLWDRMEWARSYYKLAGVLESRRARPVPADAGWPRCALPVRAGGPSAARGTRSAGSSQPPQSPGGRRLTRRRPAPWARPTPMSSQRTLPRRCGTASGRIAS